MRKKVRVPGRQSLTPVEMCDSVMASTPCSSLLIISLYYLPPAWWPGQGCQQWRDVAVTVWHCHRPANFGLRVWVMGYARPGACTFVSAEPRDVAAVRDKPSTRWTMRRALSARQQSRLVMYLDDALLQIARAYQKR